MVMDGHLRAKKCEKTIEMAHETKARSHKTLRFFPIFFVWEQIFNFKPWLVMSSSLDLSLFGLRPARRPHQWTPIPSSVPWGPQGVSTALGVDCVSPANGRGFLPFARNEAWTGGECGFWIHHDWTGSYGGKTWEGAVERNERYGLDRRWNSKGKVWELFLLIGVLYVFKLKLHVYRNMTCISRLSVLTMVVYIHTCIDL